MNPCRHGGSCEYSAHEDGFHCTCTHNFTGATCETSVTESAPRDLKNTRTNDTYVGNETFGRLRQDAIDAINKGRTIVQGGPTKQNALTAIDHIEVPVIALYGAPGVSSGLPTGSPIISTADGHNITVDVYNSTGNATPTTDGSPVSITTIPTTATVTTTSTTPTTTALTTTATLTTTTTLTTLPTTTTTTTTTKLTTTTTLTTLPTTTKLTTLPTTTKLTTTATLTTLTTLQTTTTLKTTTTTTPSPGVRVTPPTPLRVHPVLFTLLFILITLWLLVGAACVSVFLTINWRRAEYLDERYRRLAEDHDNLLSILASEEESAQSLVAPITPTVSTSASQIDNSLMTVFSSWISPPPDVTESKSDTVRTAKSAELSHPLKQKSSNTSVTENRYKKKWKKARKHVT